MTKKKVKTVIHLQIKTNKTTPTPPIGTTLGPHKINIMEFCKTYNEHTTPQTDTVIPAEITVYEDRTFTFMTKTPPTYNLLKKTTNVDKNSGTPNREKIGTVTKQQMREIAEQKMQDLNTFDIDQTMKIIEKTTHSIGLNVN